MSMASKQTTAGRLEAGSRLVNIVGVGTGQCGGLAIVHRTRRFTCSDAECVDERLGRSAFRNHSVFVSCDEVLGGECPACRETDSAEAL